MASRRVSVGDFKIGVSEKDAIRSVLEDGRISEGRKVREFEKKFADFIGIKSSILLNSGTSALIAGLSALTYAKNLNIKPKQKIITAPLTYIATSNAIVLSGFEPVYVDIDKNTFGITPENIRALLEKEKHLDRYAVILPVHLMGFSCDMDGINKVAKEYGLQVAEDASQAHGTLYNGKKTGSLSLFSTFSFYIAHNIQVGEMGAVATNDSEMIRLIRKIKANGRLCDCDVCNRNIHGCVKLKDYKGEEDFDPRFTHTMIGYNFKTSDLFAALGICQLEKVDLINAKRRENVKYLNDRLKKFDELLQLPLYSEDVSYLAYPIIIKKPDIISRRFLRSKLQEYGIETRPFFGCIPTQQPAYSYLKKEYEGQLPNAEYIGKNGFYIGCHQYIEKDDLDYIVHIFEKILGN